MSAQAFRRFELHRAEDATGVSGTGVVVEGVQFTDGTVALRWVSGRASTCVYASMEDVEVIHGHGGRTVVVWVDRTDRRKFPITLVRESDGRRFRSHVWGATFDEALNHLEAVFADAPEVWDGWTYETH